MQLCEGSPVRLGMDFKGGTMVKIKTGETKEELTAKFSAYPDVFARGTGVKEEKMLQFGPMEENQKDELLNRIKTEYEAGTYEIKDTSAVFGRELQIQTVYAVIIAFILMAIVVFIVFRTVVPPFAVILSAFSDIVLAVACMDLVGMQLSLGIVAALLMLIGYSVDSDILLTTNLLRKRGEMSEKLRSAMKTGITMTSTTLSAVLAMFVVSSYLHLFSSYYAPIPMLRDISVVLLFGLCMDVMNTWLLNAGILRWYIQRKEEKKYTTRSKRK
jgi:preprotein translocase subunit SecF